MAFDQASNYPPDFLTWSQADRDEFFANAAHKYDLRVRAERADFVTDPDNYPDKPANGNDANGGANASTNVPVQPRIMSKAAFLAGFVPPDYLVDGIFQRRFIYALTGQTGHAKTAIALLLAELVSSLNPDAMLGLHKVEKGRVCYFAGENPDDLRMRVIGADALRAAEKPDQDRISFIPGVFNITEMMNILTGQFTAKPLDLVIVDTSAAYFLGSDEISNTDMGKHARMLRALTTLPGGPCIVVLCHPVKYVQDPSQLLPRGGGAFMAEIDGNLTSWLHDDIVQLHHSKMRGPGFEPISFKLDKFTTHKMVDAKGRPVPTVRAVYATDGDEERQTGRVRDDEDQVLARLLASPNDSFGEIALNLGWSFKSGEPAKSRVQFAIDRLKREKPALIVQIRGKWALTEQGKTSARKAAARFDLPSTGTHEIPF